MTTSHRRLVGAGIAATALAAFVAGTPAAAGAAPAKHGPKPASTTVQLLSFNDYHGHLEATDPNLAADVDLSATPVGGAVNLATKLGELRAAAGDSHSLTVAAGDLIGGSTFLSGIFHDEPSVESLNAMGLDVSSVGNHEFDEGTDELLRMQRGGCHPVDGCYFPDAPYAGADFQYLAANVVLKDRAGRRLVEGPGPRQGAHPAAGDRDQEGRRGQGRLHRHDARGHADPGQPHRRLDRRLQG